MALSCVKAEFAEAETGHLDGFNAAGERFRRMFDEVRRSAAQNEKTARRPFPVREYPKNRKQVRIPLDFINDHKSLEVLQGHHRFIEPGTTHRVFKIEVVGRTGVKKPARRSRFPALAGADKRDDATAFQGGFNGTNKGFSFNHVLNITLKILHGKKEFQGK
jgi:hypothetical protein